MSSPIQAEKANAANTARNIARAAGMRDEIAQRWGKFTAAEIAALKNMNDLIAKVKSKYKMDRDQAVSDVDTFANGRQF